MIWMMNAVETHHTVVELPSVPVGQSISMKRHHALIPYVYKENKYFPESKKNPSEAKLENEKLSGWRDVSVTKRERETHPAVLRVSEAAM